jgi:hypothetical protein
MFYLKKHMDIVSSCIMEIYIISLFDQESNCVIAELFWTLIKIISKSLKHFILLIFPFLCAVR